MKNKQMNNLINIINLKKFQVLFSRFSIAFIFTVKSWTTNKYKCI